MKTYLLALLTLCPLAALSQSGTTFTVESLSKPESLLRMESSKEIFKELIYSDLDLASWQVEKESMQVPLNIVKIGQVPDSLVSFGYHSFFNGMYQAYADHRPFVLSPDMVWLLISQGFAHHVRANAEQLRHHFVDFSGKLSLVVQTSTITLDNPDSPWESVFPEFSKQIAQHTGNELVALLTSDFSTTTATEKLASEITIMKAMEPYFEFVVIYAVCGIPEITLQGTTADWQRVLDKTRQLAKYDLTWWTNELEPVLEEFVNASKGNVNKRFWRNMFKQHSQKKYGAPAIIDGWVVKFFPYDKDGKRNNLEWLEGNRSLPEEIVKVDLLYVDTKTSTPLELWAGFIGLEQDASSYALRPKIGWMIRKKDTEQQGLKEKLAYDSDSSHGMGINIRVKEVPPAILALKKVRDLEISFIDTINIPDQLAEVEIKVLVLRGKIGKEETKRIQALFPRTLLIINGKEYNANARQSDEDFLMKELGIKIMK